MGIPPVRDTDGEDVAWALQTADALWKRNERIDAIVWLRRAAQAAGDAEDDERAVALARDAAELSELVASSAPDPSRAGPVPTDGSNASAQVDDLLRAAAPDTEPQQEETLSRKMFLPRLTGPEAVAPQREPLVDPSQEEQRPSVRTADQVHAGILDPWAELPAEAERIARASAPIPRLGSRLDDDEVITSARHIGAAKAVPEQEPTTNPRVPVPRAPPPPRPPPPLPPRSSSKMVAAPPRGETPSQPRQPVASQPQLPPQPRQPAAPPPRPPMPSQPRPPMPSQPRQPVASPPRPPMPSQPRPPMPSQPQPPFPSQPRQPVAAPPRPPMPSQPRQPVASQPRQPVASQPRQPVDSQPRQPAASQRRPPPSSDPRGPQSEPISVPISVEPPVSAPRQAIPAAPRAAGPLDLSGVEALGDLPDDARADFARIAKVTEIGREEEVSSFALAYVISGEVDVSATMVDAPAVRCAAGSILRGRGSISDSVPLRLIAVTARALVATWNDEEVLNAFRGCPWVEEDLRAAADRVQALAGVTVGPLGERLDRALRDQVMSRLELRVLRTGDVVVEKGKPVPGLIVVGVGELELTDGDVVKQTLGSGEFLFTEAVLGAGPAPLTARAGKGGVLAMSAPRAVAQELLVTCPPLLELFAGM